MNAKIVKSKKLVSCLALSIFILFSFMVTTDFVYAQASGRITGKVVEAGTKAALPGANVIIVGTNMGAATDRQGYFIISKVPPGMYELSVSFI
ncbi:MAG: carboxypeptidase-like regulatory domain-containing protein, partial [bacterium]